MRTILKQRGCRWIRYVLRLYYGGMELLSLGLRYIGHQKENGKGADRKRHGAGE